MKDRIFTEVQKTRKRYCTNDPFALLDAMGVIVQFSYGYSSKGLRGYCAMMNRIMYAIINGKLTEEEQRVVAAHESAHLILHKSKLKAGAMRDFDIYNATGKLEQEANFFAADFLIDDDAVLELLQSYDMDFFDTAKALLIPPQFFAFKLYSMMERGYPMRMPVDLNSTFLKGRR